MGSHKDYDYLVAAHLLRTPDFASSYGPLFVKVEGQFFEDFFLRDVVLYGIRYYLDTGVLLPPQALKVDVRLFGRDGASQDNYDLEIDRVWEIPPTSLVRSQAHVRSKLVGEVQSRLLLQTDLHQYCTPGSLGELYRLLDEIRTLDAVSDGEARRLSEGLLDALRDPPAGVPTGIGGLDASLAAGGPVAGEVVLFYGRYSIGKSILLSHAARHAARKGKTALYWAIGDSSQKLMELRMAKGFLGWTDGELRSDPEGARRRYLEEFGDLALYCLWSPPSKTSKAQIVNQIDRVEQKEGKRLDLLAMDYSEKRSPGRDWNQVCDTYEEFQEICGERQVVGMDVAQENQSGKISYFNLLKDAPIGVQLTVLSPDEWRRRQRSTREQDSNEIKIPTRGTVYGEVVRSREGVSNTVFELWMDRERGTVETRQKGGEVA